MTSTAASHQAPTPASSPSPSILITAGPTQEPIDAVRFIGNRSSGRLGVALADGAAGQGWTTTLLLGATPRVPSDPRVRVDRFRTTADLSDLLDRHLASCDILVMAAAVADYRPKVRPEDLAGKRRRVKGGLVLEFESTPDLLAACAARRRPDQLLVGFALEPRAEMLASARSKLARKRIDMIVANPLETMDGPTIEATVIDADGSEHSTPGAIAKEAFAPWLLKLLAARLARPAAR